MFKTRFLGMGKGIFHAPDGTGAGGNSSNNADSGSNVSQNTDTANTQTADQNGSTTGTTFSQADLNRIGAQEKANGRKSMLKELGFDDDKTAKAELTAYKKWKESQQSEAEKAQEAVKTATKAQGEAENRATAAENKCAVLMEQGNPEFINDIMALAAVRVNDTTDFAAAVKLVKASHPNLFGTKADNGTGGSIGHGKNTNVSTNVGIGQRLAQKNAKERSVENPYFK